MEKSSVPQMEESSKDSVVQGLQKMGYQPELTRVRSNWAPLMFDTEILNYSLEAYFTSYSVRFSNRQLLLSCWHHLKHPSFSDTRYGRVFNWWPIRIFDWHSCLAKTLAIMAVREYYYSYCSTCVHASSASKHLDFQLLSQLLWSVEDLRPWSGGMSRYHHYQCIILSLDLTG